MENGECRMRNGKIKWEINFLGGFYVFCAEQIFFSVDYRYPRFILKNFSGKIKEQNKLSATSSYEVYFRK